MLQAFSIFNSFKFWNNSRISQSTDKITVILSFLLIVLIVILFALKIIELSSFSSTVATWQTVYEQQPQMTTLSTYLNDQKNSPFMAAISLTSDSSCSSGPIKVDVTASVTVGQYNTSTRKTQKLSLSLQSCTESHFSTIAGGLSKIKEWTEGQLYCLPLSRYIQLGGSNKSSKSYKNLQFGFTCPSSCNSTPSCGSVQLFSLTSTPNIHNSSFPFAYTFDRRSFPIQSSPSIQYALKIDSTTITSDNSLLPFSVKEQSLGSSVGQFIVDIPATDSSIGTILTVQRSDRSINYSRSFLKFFEVLGYIGGVIQSLVLIFWFMRGFSHCKFELQFAKTYFKTNQAKNFSLGSFIKQNVFNLLKLVKVNVNWDMVEKRAHLQTTIHKYLDVYYLNRRILFLQDAISILFQSYQLKGLYLAHSLSLNQADIKLKNYQLRDRMLSYLSKTPENHKQSSNSESLDPLPSNTHMLNEKKQQSTPMKKLISESKIIYKDHSHIEKFEEERTKRHRISFPKLFELEEEEIQHSHQLQNQSIKNEAELFYESLADSQHHKNRQSMEKQLKIIGHLSSQEIDEHELAKQLETDIKKLMEEGRKRDGDAKTLKIVERLQQWLKYELNEAVARKAESRSQHQHKVEA